MTKKRYRKNLSNKGWITTYTKLIVSVIMFVCLLDLQFSYLLAFLGREQIAESLSTTIAQTIIATTLGYLIKALTETYLLNREKRLTGTIEYDDLDDDSSMAG